MKQYLKKIMDLVSLIICSHSIQIILKHTSTKNDIKRQYTDIRPAAIINLIK